MVSFDIEAYNRFVKLYNIQSKDTNSYYTQLVSHFEGVIDFADVYALNTGKVEKDRTLPFFSTGTEHSNILRYEFQVPEGLFFTLSKRRLSKQNDLVEEYKTDPSGVVESFVSQVKTYYKQAGVNYLNDNEDEIKKRVNLSLSSFMSDEAGVEVEGAGDGVLETTLFLDTLLQLGGFFNEGGRATGIRGVITTVPMYHLSDISDIGTACVVAIGNNPRPYQHLDLAALSKTFYSGIYLILGITHYVDSNPRSEFEIVKIAPFISEENTDQSLEEQDS